MQAFWGNDGLPVNDAEVTSAYTLITSDWGQTPLRYECLYSVRVVLLASGQAALTKEEKAWRDRLMTPNKDFVLKQDSGAASSAAIFVKDTMSGTRVMNIRAPESQGAEFVKRRTITFDIAATYKVKNSGAAIVSWTESVVIIGNGGPDRQWRFPLNAVARREILSPTSLVRAVQSGSAVGHTSRPFRPLPIWPDYQVNPQDTKGIDTPMWMGREFVNYPIRWQYTFERGDGPLIGLPSLPSGV